MCGESFMAFLKYANAVVAKPIVSLDAWRDFCAKGLPFNKRAAASKLLLQKYDPSSVLLSHATIMASVDIENGPGALGRHLEQGQEVDRRFADYYITPNTSKYVNSNGDSWSRAVLLATYKGFIGAQNYCFVPDTMVVLSDGTQKAIQDVCVGDEVLTHTGDRKKVLKTFERVVDEEICTLYFDRYKNPIKCTSEHPFRVLSVEAPQPRVYRGSKATSQERYKRDAVRRVLRDQSGPFMGRVLVHDTWINSGDLTRYSLALGPRGSLQEGGDVRQATLLGYYLSEGCLIKNPKGRLDGIILSFGLHETALCDHAKRLAQEVFGASVRVSPTQCNTLQVHIVGLGVGPWFKLHGGEYSESKRLSSVAMSWSKECLTAILAAWLSGDASRHKKTERVIGLTTSEDLACQMFRICDVVGVKSSLWRETVAGFQKRKLLRSSVVLTVGGEPKEFTIQAKNPNYNVIISRGSFYRFNELTPRWTASHSRSTRKRDDFDRYGDCKVHQVSWVGREHYTGKVYNFEVEGDNSYVLGQCGVAVHNCEHLQIPELSKGRIIDAAARDIGDSIYIDILVATEKKHTPLIKAITSGQLNTMSMGCSVEFTQCSKCGNVAVDETQLCRCVKYSKLSTFFDTLGQKRVIAELCGHSSNPNSVKFIEASWVGNPAFKGAVIRNILSPDELAQYAPQIGKVFSFPAPVADPSLRAKAAQVQGHVVRQLGNPPSRVILGQGQEFDFGQGGQFEGADDAPKAEETPKEDPLQKAVDDLAGILKEKALEKVRGEITQKELPPRADLNENKNEGLIREASHDAYWRGIARSVLAKIKDPTRSRRILLGLLLFKTGGWNAIREANCFSGREVLGISKFLDEFEGVKIAGEARVYRTVLAVGGASPYGDVEGFLAACRRVFRRELTSSERDALITKGRLYDLGSL